MLVKIRHYGCCHSFGISGATLYWMKLIILELGANGKYGNEGSVTIIILTHMFNALKLHIRRKKKAYKVCRYQLLLHLNIRVQLLPFLCIGPGSSETCFFY
jgi:hypothetical protein